jgi:F0F1-type ATP synthase membrane subunit c/vacuolar-type H+-ATPase subunit K
MKGREYMQMKSIAKGVGIGMAVGGATAYFRGMMRGSGMKKMARKKARTIMKAADTLMGDMKYMFK